MVGFKDLRMVQEDHNKGANAVLASIAFIVAAGMLLYLGILVNGKFRNAVPTTDLPAAFNETLTQVDGNLTSAYDMSGIGIFVVAAVAILAVVMGITQLGR